GQFEVELDTTFFTKTSFSLNTVNTKTFVLMLAREGPLNFVSGGDVPLGDVLRNCNKKEFHHLFPRKYLSDLGIDNARINALTNLAILSKADNNRLGGVRPSEYRKRMPESDERVRLILERALCPNTLFSDDFDAFEKARSELLVQKGRQLMKL
ncbi:MAG: hypothetical protein ACREDR_46455, partial [Blastocatellia bacterium]